MVGIRVDGCDPELIDRFRIQPENWPIRYIHSIIIQTPDHQVVRRLWDVGVARLRVIDIHAVQSNVGLIGTRACNVAFSGGPGLQGQQVDYVARFQRKLGDLLVYENIAQRGVLCVDQYVLRGGFHLYHLALRSDVQLHVGLGRFTYLSANVFNDVGPETRSLNLHAVSAGHDQIERKCPRLRRLGKAYGVRGHIGQRDRGRRHHSTLSVGNSSANRRSACLSENRRRKCQDYKSYYHDSE